MKIKGCIFCKIISGELPGVEILRDETCIILMDIFPISPGHLMVIPLIHSEFSHELPSGIRSHIFEKAAMTRFINPFMYIGRQKRLERQAEAIHKVLYTR